MTKTLPAILLTLSLASVMPASAAVINWNSAEYVNTGPNLSVMGIDQIDQSGFRFLAVNLGAEGAQTLVQSVDPDIDFDASDPNFTVLGGMSLVSPAGTLHDDLGGNNNISGSAVHADILGGEVGPASFRLSNLQINESYVIQALFFDFNSFTTDVHIDGPIVGGFGQQIGGGNNGLRAIGSFTADAVTQDFVIETFDALHNPRGGLLNAIYVTSRTPEPSTAMLGGLALCCALLRRRR